VQLGLEQGLSGQADLATEVEEVVLHVAQHGIEADGLGLVRALR
jgi:hypothetical protein